MREHEKSKTEYRRGPDIWILVACRCGKWPFAHVHAGEGRWEYEPKWQFLRRIQHEG